MHTRLISWIILVVCPITLLAQSSAAAVVSTNPDGSSAMLQVIKGNVTVNGSAVQSSSIAYRGDKIETEGDSYANITQRGSVISLASRSAIVYDAGIVRLERGEVTVGTKGEYHGRLKNLTVTPSSNQTQYRMMMQGCEIRITALKGSVFVDDGKNTVLLNHGKYIRKLNESRVRVRQDEGDGDDALFVRLTPSSQLPPSPTDKDHSKNQEECPAILPSYQEPGTILTRGVAGIPLWAWAAGGGSVYAVGANLLKGGSPSSTSGSAATPISPSAP